MRLADFIVADTETILSAWDAFARTILPASGMDGLALRDHAADILLATVRDMDSAKSETHRADRRTGYRDGSERSRRLNGASEEHAIGRLDSGFNLMQLVSEYGALRISVLGLWRQTTPAPHFDDIADLTLFNESIDQSLAKAVSCYTKRVEESRNMFLAILSHDLRNPLNSIAMSAALLPQDAHDPESSSAVARISNNALVMGRMISDLLDYTRTRLGAGMPVTRAPMDLGTVARGVFDEYQSSNPRLRLRFKSTGDVTGNWDTDRLRQVVSNLLGNAIQHGDPNEPIELTLAGRPSEVVVSIHNNGAPIPVGEIVKIFDPLVRGAASSGPTSHRPGSIGLGLYIARELVIAHGGRIGVTSSADVGTVFTFRLPRHPQVDLPDIHPGANLSTSSPAQDAPVEAAG